MFTVLLQTPAPASLEREGKGFLVFSKWDNEQNCQISNTDYVMVPFPLSTIEFDEYFKNSCEAAPLKNTTEEEGAKGLWRPFL